MSNYGDEAKGSICIVDVEISVVPAAAKEVTGTAIDFCRSRVLPSA